MQEEIALSDSDQESDGDIYGADPVFKSKEDLDEFMRSCKIQTSMKSGDKEELSFHAQRSIKKNYTCGMCQDIWSGDFEHICCQQIKPR